MGSRRAILVTVALTAGCSLGSFTGYSSGGVDPNDAGSDATTTSDTDAGGLVDGAVNDAAPGDGGLSDADAGGCTAKFCEGFEANQALAVNWDVVIAEGGGTVDYVTAPSPVHSGMRALRVVTSTSTSARAFIEKKFTTTTTHATFSFWMNMPTPGRVIQLARIRLDAPNGKAGNYILQSKTNGTLVVAEQYFDGADYVGFVSHDLTAFQANVWQQWKLEVDATTSPPHGKVYVGGQLVVDDPLTNPFLPGVARAYVGNSYVETGPAITYFFDDIAFDFTP